MRKKIIVVEDDYDTLQILVFILEDEGFEVFPFEKISSLTDLIDQNADLIILDLWLPVYNGQEIASVLKADTKSEHTPIMFLSAVNNLDSIALQSKVEAYISKPFDYEHFMATIKKLVN